jgi:hypothetical protein
MHPVSADAGPNNGDGPGQRLLRPIIPAREAVFKKMNGQSVTVDGGWDV